MEKNSTAVYGYHMTIHGNTFVVDFSCNDSCRQLQNCRTALRCVCVLYSGNKSYDRPSTNRGRMRGDAAVQLQLLLWFCPKQLHLQTETWSVVEPKKKNPFYISAFGCCLGCMRHHQCPDIKTRCAGEDFIYATPGGNVVTLHGIIKILRQEMQIQKKSLFFNF